MMVMSVPHGSDWRISGETGSKQERRLL